MKKLNRLFIFSVTLLSLICTSCNKGYDDNSKNGEENYEFKVKDIKDALASANNYSAILGTSINVTYFNNERVAFVELNDMVIKVIEQMFIDSPLDYTNYLNTIELNLTNKESLFLPTIRSFNSSNYVDFFKTKFINEIIALFNKYSKNKYGKDTLIQMLSLFLGATDLIVAQYKNDNYFTTKEIFVEVNNNLKKIFKK